MDRERARAIVDQLEVAESSEPPELQNQGVRFQGLGLRIESLARNPQHTDIIRKTTTTITNLGSSEEFKDDIYMLGIGSRKETISHELNLIPAGSVDEVDIVFDEKTPFGLKLRASYSAHIPTPDFPRLLLFINATWITKSGIFAQEKIHVSQLDSPDAYNTLLLLEESVAAAESELQRRNEQVQTSV